MTLIRITDLAPQLGLSSRSLRYYEEAGLIQSVRPPGEKYRFFDEATIQRLKQIIVLRKMMIPIKDIQRIYQSSDMSVVVEVFVSRIQAIDRESAALSELRRITDDFLNTLQKNGIKKVSALPLLYEALTQQQLDSGEEKRGSAVSYDELTALSARLTKPVEPAILRLPAMGMLSSRRKEDPQASDPEGFWQWIQMQGLSPGHPGAHERFEYQSGEEDVILLKMAEDYAEDGPYCGVWFEGGLFAAINAFLDEDLGECFRALVLGFDDNPYYEIDYLHDGRLRHEALLETLISPDEKRELVSLLVPVKKRLADPALFQQPEEARGISIEEIEAANPILWEATVPLDKMTQSHVNNSYFRINGDGEAEYIGWILRAVLNTRISVKLPFRVDLEFRLSGQGKTGIILYHSEDTGYPLGRIGHRGFGVNMSNDNEHWTQAIRFAQPLLGDDFHFPGRGALRKDAPNKLTWIVGEKHLAAIINGQVRYCGTGFPYMSLDWDGQALDPIVIGASYGHDTIILRSIRVSQLAETRKNKLKKGELTMITKQSNNIIPIIHRLVTDEYGENYWFNGCAKYVMECLGEKDYDYWFFAGLTGDIFTQHYAYTKSFWDAIDGYGFEENPKQYVKETFAKCGYAATFVSKQEIQENTEMYLHTLIGYIDRGIPVINWEGPCGVYVGYEDYGKILLCITGNKNQPERIPLEQALQNQGKTNNGWIFVGEKKENLSLAQIYRDAIGAIPRHFKIQTATYAFGAEAFRAWADAVENGKFDGMNTEDFDTWAHYTNYVCVLATNGSCCHGFLKRAQALSPDMGFLEEISKLYKRMADLWNKDNGQDLEALGGGFNVTLEVLQNPEKRAKIAAKIREAAACMDQVAQILESNMC